MEYYPKVIFNLLIAFFILAIVFTIVFGFILFALSALGCSAGCPANYEKMVFQQIIYPIIAAVLFLSFSVTIVILQQYKNIRFGYLMFVSAILALFYFYMQGKWGVLNVTYEISNTPPLFLFFELILVVGGIIPFYVLGRLIKEDFFKKKT
jgi:magnesium-transporting ATPase (P-type)